MRGIGVERLPLAAARSCGRPRPEVAPAGAAGEVGGIPSLEGIKGLSSLSTQGLAL